MDATRNSYFPSPFRVDLWLVLISIASQTYGGRQIHILSRNERRKWLQLRCVDDRSRFLVSHVVLRIALSHAVGGRVAPGCWRFTERANTKPAIEPAADLPRLEFNLSHAGRLCSVAVSRSCKLGVDVEREINANECNFTSVALTDGERRWLDQQPERLRAGLLLRFWTLKEAYAKLQGVGLALPFDRVGIEFDSLQLEQAHRTQICTQRLCIINRSFLYAGDGYQLSLAVKIPRRGQVDLHTHCLDSTLKERKNSRLTQGGLRV